MNRAALIVSRAAASAPESWLRPIFIGGCALALILAGLPIGF